MAAKTKLEQALVRQTGRELYDNAYQGSGISGILMARDTMDNTRGKRIKMDKDASGKAKQVDFRVALPVTQGAQAINGSLASLELETQSNFQTVSGEMGWSYYQSREDVRTALIEQMTKAVSKNVQWVKDTAEALRDSIELAIMGDVIPPTSVTTAGQGAEAENKIMALAYPLQNATSGTYSYLGLNLADAQLQPTQAIVSGTTGSAFGVMSLSSLRTKILHPLMPRRAKIDIALVDSDIFDYMLTQAEGKVVLAQEDQLNYGGSAIRYGGIWWCYEPKLDDVYDTTTYREALFLQSDTWEYTYAEIGDSSLTMNDNPRTNLLKTLLFACAVQLLCYHPRKNARAYNVSKS